MNPTKTNPQTILKRLTISRKGIKIITHERPDVDALGSVAGMGWVLNSMRVPFSVCVESWLSFCPELRPPVSASEVDVQLMLDVSDPKRAFGYDQGLETLVIDHHAVENVPFINLIDPSCCATSALLSELFFDHLDSKSSVCFLAGLLADTGVLSYSNVDERALEDAVRLVQAGANWNAAYVEATKICGMEQAKRIARLLKKIYEYKPGVFVLSVPKEDRLEHSFTDDDFSIALSIMQWIGRGILFISARENNNQTPVTNISFRSRHPLEAIEYAKRLNGGGHRMAAAAKLSNQLSEVMETVLTWVTADVEALSERYNEPANLNELDLQLAELYAKSELLSVDVTEELLLSICDLVSKGASAERAAMKVRENISLESLQELSDWIMSRDDLKSPKSLAQRMFYRQVDFSCKS